MTVNHLHYMGWPDHGVPDNVMSLIHFIRHVRKLHLVSDERPLLVHCSAGVGRTGTLILLDIVMQQMKTEGCISVLHWLRNIRSQRMKMVQRLVYNLLLMFNDKCGCHLLSAQNGEYYESLGVNARHIEKEQCADSNNTECSTTKLPG